MRLHFYFLIIVFLIALIYRKLRERNSKYSKLFLFLLFIVMSLFLGLRSINIGTDTQTYISLFWNRNYSFSNLEIIVPLISRIIIMFSNKYFIYLTVLSMISLIGIIKCVKDYKFDTEYFLLLYITSFCFLYSTSAIRFFCSFSIILISFKYMIECNTKKVVFLLLLAMMFHTSAIVFFPIYFFTKFKYTKKNLLLILICGLAFVLFIELFGNHFLFKLKLFEKYSYILNSDSSVGGLSTLMNIAILFFGIVYYNSVEKYKKEYEFFLKMQVFCILIDFVGIAYRIVWFFRFPVWFILPIILENLKIKRKKDYLILYVIFLVIYLMLYYYYLKYSLDSHNFLNYTFNKMLK